MRTVKDGIQIRPVQTVSVLVFGRRIRDSGEGNLNNRTCTDRSKRASVKNDRKSEKIKRKS